MRTGNLLPAATGWALLLAVAAVSPDPLHGQASQAQMGASALLGTQPTVPESQAMRDSHSTMWAGAAIGTVVGAGAGLLFAHEACDTDPCATSAYVLAAAAGGLLHGLTGALVGSRVGRAEPQRGFWTGLVVGAVVGAGAGAGLAGTCDDDCGAAGYVSLMSGGAATLGGIGALIGSDVGHRTSLQLGRWTVHPGLALASR